MRYFRVVNFDRYQHYRDRRPPWIKLHASVLDDYDFACLQDASKAHLMLIWVLASQVKNELPYDPEWLARKLQLVGPIDLDALASAGFIEVYEQREQGASKALADRQHFGVSETETETEKNIAPEPARKAQTESKPKGRKKQTRPPKVERPWLARFREVQKSIYGSAVIHPRYLGAFDAVVEEVGPDEALVRYGAYLRATKPAYYSADKWASTHGEYATRRDSLREAALWWYKAIRESELHLIAPGTPRFDDTLRLGWQVYGWFPSEDHARYVHWLLLAASPALTRAMRWNKQDEAVSAIAEMLTDPQMPAPAVPVAGVA